MRVEVMGAVMTCVVLLVLVGVVGVVVVVLVVVTAPKLLCTT